MVVMVTDISVYKYLLVSKFVVNYNYLKNILILYRSRSERIDWSWKPAALILIPS